MLILRSGVESVLRLHFSARQHPPSLCSIFLLMRNTALGSFSWRWRIDQQCAQCPLCWSPLALKLASKGGGPHLTGCEGHTFSGLLWSSSFDQLSHPVYTPLFGSQKWQMNQLWADCEFVSQQRCNKSVSEKWGTNFSPRRAHTSFRNTHIHIESVFEWWVSSAWLDCLLEAIRKTRW